MVLLYSVAVSYFVWIAHFVEGRQARRLKHGSVRRGSGSSALSLQGLGMVCSIGSLTVRCRHEKSSCSVYRVGWCPSGILEWDDASSALHHGIVNACIPAAEEALKLLPPGHFSRTHTARLVPYGRVYSYQAAC